MFQYYNNCLEYRTDALAEPAAVDILRKMWLIPNGYYYHGYCNPFIGLVFPCMINCHKHSHPCKFTLPVP